MKVELVRTEGAQFRAENEAGRVTWISGSPEIGASEQGIRPMENVLASLAGCSAIDVLLILQRGRHTVTTLKATVEGERVDAVPAVFSKIHVHFTVGGDFDAKKLERAVTLSMEKYCSVVQMLQPTVEITHSVTLAE